MNEDLEEASVQAGCTRPESRPTAAQAAYLRRGLAEPGGKLPLFDRDGQRYSRRTIQSCIDQGWAKPWFHNPIKPDWLICRLTKAGESALAEISPAVPPAHHARQGTGCDARRLQRLVRDLVEA
jgi:hypothetical protein